MSWAADGQKRNWVGQFCHRDDASCVSLEVRIGDNPGRRDYRRFGAGVTRDLKWPHRHIVFSGVLRPEKRSRVGDPEFLVILSWSVTAEPIVLEVAFFSLTLLKHCSFTKY